MKRLLLATALLLSAGSSPLSALEVKNLRAAHGPMGATRHDSEFLPADMLFLTFDVAGLTASKDGELSYVSTMELIDPDGKVLYTKKGTKTERFGLGGSILTGQVHLILPRVPPGRYVVRWAVEDRNAAGAEAAFEYPFTLRPPGLGTASLIAPAFGFPGEYYSCAFDVNGLAEVAGNLNGDIAFRILDAAGKPVQVETRIPIPGLLVLGPGRVWVTQSFLANRPGSFTMHIMVTDNNAKRSVEVRYPFTIIDVGEWARKQADKGPR
jgi:hypothetical protein